ncbi:condensation domain-containing protein [Moraxella marmotae]|uniref:condensation domain-containing protein n=1 Tax=Moraxella marmotae TaxID=3344520 RepID=UPI0035F418C0
MNESKQAVDIILKEFRDALEEPTMQADDNFFDFGGHSLLATRVIGNLIHKHGMSVAFQDFFKSPSAQELAGKVTNQDATGCLTDQVAQNKPNDITFPLSNTQSFLWQAYQKFNFSSIYNLPFVIEFDKPVDENIFFQAFNSVLERHPSLRTRFISIDNKILQNIVPMSKVGEYKWFWFSYESLDATLADEANYRFNLHHELPIRIRFFPSSDKKSILSLLIHHMVIDEWSLNTLMRDLKQAYFCYSQGINPDWQGTPGSMQEFVEKQINTGINLSHLEYWKSHLQNVKLPAQPSCSTSAKSVEIGLNLSNYQTLQNIAKANNSSLFLVFYTIIALALHEEFNYKELIVGTSASGRTDVQFFDTIGYFTTMIAHKINLSNQKTFLESLNHISALVQDSLQYADIPINIIQQEMEMPKDQLMFDVYIHIHSNNALHGSIESADGRIINYRQLMQNKTESMFGMHFEIMDNRSTDNNHELKIIITYQTKRYDARLIHNLYNKINKIIHTLTTNII